MGKNKIIISMLSFLFVVTFALGVVGYLNKDSVKPVNPTPDTPNVPDTPVSGNVTPVEYTGEVNTLESLETIVGGYEFVKANKENVYGDVRAFIDADLVHVEISDEITNEDGTTTTDTRNYDVSDVTSPVAVHVQVSDNEEKSIRVYILNAQGNFYCAMLNGNTANYSGVTIFQYNIPNIESFVSLNVPLKEDGQVSNGYVIIKTTEGKYFTDYNFNGADGIVLSELTTNTNTDANTNADATDNQATPVVETKLNDKKENIKNAALLYVKSNELLKEDGQVNIYVYKLIEEGLLQVDAEAVSEKCVQTKNNTSMGCILDPTDETKTLNPDYVMISKIGNDYTGEYVSSK